MSALLPLSGGFTYLALKPLNDGSSMGGTKTAVLCIGAVCRGDDGAALLVADHLQGASVPVFVLPDPSLIYEYLSLYDRLIIVDAIPTQRTVEQGDIEQGRNDQDKLKQGEVREYLVSEGEIPNQTSGHAISLSEWIRLARTLGHAPREIRLFGISGDYFKLGASPSPGVVTGAERCAQQIHEILSSRDETNRSMD